MQLTIASRCPPTPLSIAHAGTCVVSLPSVPSVTGVGHCGSKSCTRGDFSTICRSFGGRTTADSCTEDKVTTLLVAIMQVHKMRKQNAHRHQLYIYRHVKHINYIYITKPHTDACIYIHESYTPTQAWCT